MPHDKIDEETDGNPETMYEDTTEHDRTGFIVNNNVQNDSKATQKESADDPDF
jgi:hypothetical protein